MVLPAPELLTNSADQRHIGRYVLSGTLGSGAMGTVYRAVDPLIERTVALKVLSIDMHTASHAGFRERFFREAKSAGRLNHPNIVTIYDVGESEGTPYIAMEFLPGLTLRESLDSGIVMPIRKIVDIAMLVARGLEYAHQNGVIHRDIKPANIMLARSGTVKIMDFGIALATDAGRTMTDAVLGSPKYMAPEQIGNAPLDARTDVFALGVTLYELLTGKDAFDGASIPEVMHKVLHITPPSPASLNPDVPAQLDAIVMRALAKNPADRFERAKEMGRALGTLRRVLRNPMSERTAPTSSATAGAKPTPAVAPRSGRRSSRARPPAPARGISGRTILIGTVLVLAVFMVLFVTTLKPDAVAPNIPAAPTATAAIAATGDMVDDASGDSATDSASGEGTGSDDATPEAAVASGTPDDGATVTARAAPAPSRAEPRPQTVPQAQTRQAAARAPATLLVSVLPWGEIHINGELRGVTPPLREIELAPGEHRIEIRNADFPAHVENVTLESGISHRISHRFRQ